uniref:Minor capsid protein P8 central region domain-containing protein n=1 Tax=viral metagenome TaxID=1070528 RepID=A0A6C0DQL7_9ZZZZ
MPFQKLSAVSSDYNDMIININEYNGRVNIKETPSTNIIFDMHERISLNNKTTEYREALTGNLETNALSQVFFSAANIQIIQNGLRAGVYAMSNNQYVIAPQNIDNLKIIMRSTYLQYAQHYPDNIKKQVERLNRLVLEYAVPSVYNEAVGYMKYMEDQSTLVVPLELPQQTDRVYKQLELKRWV